MFTCKCKCDKLRHAVSAYEIRSGVHASETALSTWSTALKSMDRAGCVNAVELEFVQQLLDPTFSFPISCTQVHGVLRCSLHAHPFTAYSSLALTPNLLSAASCVCRTTGDRNGEPAKPEAGPAAPAGRRKAKNGQALMPMLKFMLRIAGPKILTLLALAMAKTALSNRLARLQVCHPGTGRGRQGWGASL